MSKEVCILIVSLLMVVYSIAKLLEMYIDKSSVDFEDIDNYRAYNKTKIFIYFCETCSMILLLVVLLYRRLSLVGLPVENSFRIASAALYGVSAVLGAISISKLYKMLKKRK